MARIFISGSADGLGLMAGELLLQQGHQVTFHARNTERADQLKRKLPQASAVVTGEVDTLSPLRALPDQCN